MVEQAARAIRTGSRWLAHLELFAAQALIVLFTGLLLFNVVRRYLFNRPLFFAEELAVYILIWMAFLAISVTIARQEMVRLTFLVDALSPRLRYAVNLMVEIMVLAMLAAMVKASWIWFNAPAVAFERALTLGMAKWPFLLIIPLFCTLATIHVIANIVGMLFLPEERPAK